MGENIEHCKFFDYLYEKISPDPFNGQILIEICESENSVEKATKIITGVKIQIKSIEYFKDSHEQLRAALFILNTEDVQGIVLKLVESGFLRIVGFKPLKAFA